MDNMTEAHMPLYIFLTLLCQMLTDGVPVPSLELIEPINTYDS